MKKALLFLALIAATLTTQAGVVLSDDFSYPDGRLVDNSTWLPNTGTTPMLVTNEQLIVSSQRSEDIVKLLNGAPYTISGSVTALYSSYTVKSTFRPTSSGSYFSHFTGTNQNGGFAGHRGRIAVATVNHKGETAPDNGFFIGIQNTSGAYPTNGLWQTALLTNTTYTVVSRIVLATGECTIWINPGAETDLGATDTQSLPIDPASGVIDISSYGFRQATGIGTMWVDDFKVGTSFNDVAGANTAPTISSIADQTIAAGISTGPLAFTVNDKETAANALTVTGSSDNMTLVPDANVVVAGTGAERTVTVTPAAGQQGTAQITLTVSDGVNSSPTSFTVKIGFPTISTVPNQIVPVGTSSDVIPFTVGDGETAAAALSLTASSSDAAVIAESGIVLGGSGANRTVKVTPQAGVSGFAIVTVTVSDGVNNSSTTFSVTVPAATGIVLSDTFTYPDGPLWLSGPWQTHASPTATNFSQLQVTNGMAELSKSHAEDLAADLTSGALFPSSGAVLYAGFKVLFTELPSTTGNYFLHFKDTSIGTTFRGKVFAQTSGAAEGQFRLGVANTANSPSAQFPLDLSLNRTYGVVVRYNVATAETVLWVNPANASSMSVAATDFASTSGVSAFGLRQDSGIGTNYVDNLVISSSFADVNPGISSPTPVPLQVQRNGQSLVISWSNPALKLQSAPAINGPWSAVPNATSPHTVPAATGSAFFRLTE